MRIKIAFFSILATATLGYSETTDISDYAADVIFQHAQNAIDYTDGENVFLQSDKVYLWEGVAFVEGDQDQIISLPWIDTIESNLYLAANPRMQRNDMIPIWICSTFNCGQRYYTHPGKCDICHGTDFYVRYMIPDEDDNW